MKDVELSSFRHSILLAMPADPVLPSLISVISFCENSLVNPFARHFWCEQMFLIPIASSHS